MVKNTIRVIVPETHVYFGGDTVYGLVELNVVSELKARAVRFFFHAFEHVHWTEQHGAGKTARTVTYSARRPFLTHRIDFFGAPRDQRDKAHAEIVPLGLHRYPFAVALPKHIPPSFNVGSADITYLVTAYVDIPRAFDLKHCVALNVGGNLIDQHFFSEPTGPVTLDKTAKFMFASGKMNLQAMLPQANYFIGDAVPIVVNVKNKSGKSVDAIKVELVTKGVWTTSSNQYKVEYAEEKIAYAIKIDEKEVKDGIALEYKIPPVIPTLSNLPNVQNFLHHIHLEHFLRVRLDVPWASDPYVDLPIKVIREDPRLPKHAPAPPSVPVQTFQGIPDLHKEERKEGEGKFEKGTSQFNFFPIGAVYNPGPIYPILDGYQYPVDTNAAILATGNYQFDDEETSLLG